MKPISAIRIYLCFSSVLSGLTMADIFERTEYTDPENGFTLIHRQTSYLRCEWVGSSPFCQDQSWYPCYVRHFKYPLMSSANSRDIKWTHDGDYSAVFYKFGTDCAQQSKSLCCSTLAPGMVWNTSHTAVFDVDGRPVKEQDKTNNEKAGSPITVPMDVNRGAITTLPSIKCGNTPSHFYPICDPLVNDLLPWHVHARNVLHEVMWVTNYFF